MKTKDKPCEYCDDLCNKYVETITINYKDGFLQRSDLRCKYCGRLLFEDIE